MYMSKEMRLHTVKCRIFEYLKYDLHVTDSFIRHLSMQAREDYVANALIFKLDLMFTHNKVKNTVIKSTYKHPATWLDMLLDKYAPSWLTAWRPVKFKVLDIKTEINYYNMCHHLVSDAEFKHVHFLDTPFVPNETEDSLIETSDLYRF